MKKHKDHSLCIGIHKLRELKDGKSVTVSHASTPVWLNFYRKKPPRVRFFDIMYGENITFTVKTVKEIIQAGEYIIRIEVGKRVYET